MASNFSLFGRFILLAVNPWADPIQNFPSPCPRIAPDGNSRIWLPRHPEFDLITREIGPLSSLADQLDLC
jgi:hypothetical protein